MTLPDKLTTRTVHGSGFQMGSFFHIRSMEWELLEKSIKICGSEPICTYTRVYKHVSEYSDLKQTTPFFSLRNLFSQTKTVVDQSHPQASPALFQYLALHIMVGSLELDCGKV